jgi:hypothetical protein
MKWHGKLLVEILHVLINNPILGPTIPHDSSAHLFNEDDNVGTLKTGYPYMQTLNQDREHDVHPYVAT